MLLHRGDPERFIKLEANSGNIQFIHGIDIDKGPFLHSFSTSLLSIVFK
jgi:hypothetical protein